MTIWSDLDALPRMSQLPRGSNPLRFELQGDKLCLWALINPDITETLTYRFIMLGTGVPTSETHIKYINTLFVDRFVFHFFLTFPLEFSK